MAKGTHGDGSAVMYNALPRQYSQRYQRESLQPSPSEVAVAGDTLEDMV